MVDDVVAHVGVGQFNPLGGDHRQRLIKDVLEQRQRLRGAGDLAGAEAGDGAHRVDRDIQDELAPDMPHHVVGEGDGQAAGLEQAGDGLQPFALAAVELAHGGDADIGVGDMAGAAPGAAVVGVSGHHPSGAERFGEGFDIADAVLEGEGEGSRGQDLGKQRGGGLDGVAVDRDQRHLDRPDVGGVGGGGERQDDDPLRRGNGQPLFADRRDMLDVLVEEDDVGSGLGETGAEGPAHRPCTNDCDAHRINPRT